MKLTELLATTPLHSTLISFQRNCKVQYSTCNLLW